MNGQANLDTYRRELSSAATKAGMDRSRTADPDGHAEALGIIRDLARDGVTFDADDVRRRQRFGTPTVLGAAFREAARRRWIEAVEIGTSRAPSRHGALQRRWRGREP